MIADDLSIPQTQVFEIVTETLALKKVWAKLMSLVLAVYDEQNKRPTEKTICQDLIHYAKEGIDFLNLTPPDFFLLPKVKSTLKSSHHGLVEAV